MTQIDNILSIKNSLVERVHNARRMQKITQFDLAQRSGVSLGSIKRFEHTGEISLTSLLKIALALGYENDFNELFKRKSYQSIFDVVNDGDKNAK